jgi:hypothetical protein
VDSVKPVITVVVPVWDAYVQDAFNEAVSSLLGQQPRPQILVVDNASRVCVPSFASVEVVRTRWRMPLGAARNQGLRRVTTPLVLFWDADDVMLPGTLACLLAALQRNPAAMAASARILESPGGTAHGWPRDWTTRLARWPGPYLALHSVWSLFPTTGSVLMRTHAAQAGGGFAEADSGDDWVLGVSLAARGGILHVDHPGRLYRQHAGSLWRRHRTHGHLLTHARAVRRRVKADPAMPWWLRGGLPLICGLQYVALFCARPIARFMARLQGADDG